MVTKNRAVYRGAAGAQKAEEELKLQKARAEARKEQGLMPFRFRVGVGDTTQFVVVDDAPDFYRFEHNMKNPATGFWDTFTGCTKEWDNCPACETLGRESYYAMYLTVIDFTHFKTKDGTKHEFSRKLLVVKPAQQKKIQRAYAKAQKDGGTLRGCIFEVTRDGDKDSSIGNDIEMVEVMDEDEMLTYTRSWKDKEGKTQTERCHEVFDYDALFPEPDSEDLRKTVGGQPTPGSRAHVDKELGGRPSRGRAAPRDEEEEEEAPVRTRRGAAPREEEEEAPVRPRRGAAPRAEEEAPVRPRRGAAPRDEEDDEGDWQEPVRSRGRAAPVEADEEEDEPPPRRAAGRAATTPPPRRAVRQAAPVEEEEEAPAPRRPVRPRR